MRHPRLTLLLLLAVSATSTRGAGLLLSQPGSPDARVLAHQALVHYEPGHETLLLETTFQAPGTRFAWLIPVPNLPTAEPAPNDVLQTLAPLFRPQLIAQLRPWYVDVALGIALAGALSRARRSRRPAPILLSLVLAVAWIGWLAKLSANPPGAPHTDSTGALTSALEKPEPVQRLQLQEITTLDAAEEPALVRWAEDHEVALPPDALPVIADYAFRGWRLIALIGTCENATTDPIAFPAVRLRFATTEPVLPLRFSAIQPSARPLDLFVFGPERATASGFRTLRCSRPRYPAVAPQPMDPGKGGPLRIWQPALRGLVESAPVATWLRDQAGPDRPPRDARLRFYDFEAIGERLYTLPAAATLAANVTAFALLGCALILAGVRRRVGPGYPWSTVVSRLLFVALGVGLLTFWMTPKAPRSADPRMVSPEVSPP